MFDDSLNTLNAELNPICHLLALLGAHHILHVSRIRVNNNCVSPVCSTIGMLCVVYCVVWDFNVDSRGEMCFRNEHDVCFLVLYEGFNFCSLLGEPISIP